MTRHLITSALPYANGYLHLGHVAGAYLPADIYARFLRLCGERVLYVCGSDEHGVAITIAAEKDDKTPQSVVDHYHEENAKAFQEFGMSFDIYSRTSIAAHHEFAKEWFLDLYRKGTLVEKEEEQFYDEDAQMFLPDRYVEGECPNCGSSGARGDQCDSCGAYYNQLDLKNARSLISGKPPVVRKTTHWYYPLGRYQEKLEAYIESHAHDWKSNVLQQARSWLKLGLGDRAITRDLNWGVQVPLPGARGKVLYVWFEAVLGYISATKVWAKKKGNESLWKSWWHSPETRYVAFIGKDNIVFHTLMFPAMLMSEPGYVLPANVPANEFLNLEGHKFSKSRNWSIDLRDAMNVLRGENERDALRYALAMNFPETRDADFSWKDFQSRTNNELAAIFGNFVNRTLQFVHANFGGCIPTLPEPHTRLHDLWTSLLKDFNSEPDLSLEQAYERFFLKYETKIHSHDFDVIAATFFGARKVAALYRSFRFRDAITESMNVARAANKYFNDTEPWKSLKSDRDECAKTMFICVQLVYSLGLLFAPVTPAVSRKILSTLGAVALYIGEELDGEPARNLWAEIATPQVLQGMYFSKPSILFSKVEDEFVQEQVQKLGAAISQKASGEGMTKSAAKKDKSNKTQAELLSSEGTKDDSSSTAMKNEEQKDNLISIDDFKRVQLRTAKVIAAERVAKSEKLLKLQVDTGTDTRQILAGIAKHYAPEDLLGKTVVVVVNLKPAKLMGMESQGMLLAANSSDGICIVSPAGDVLPGAEVR